MITGVRAPFARRVAEQVETGDRAEPEVEQAHVGATAEQHLEATLRVLLPADLVARLGIAEQIAREQVVVFVVLDEEDDDDVFCLL